MPVGRLDCGLRKLTGVVRSGIAPSGEEIQHRGMTRLVIKETQPGSESPQTKHAALLVLLGVTALFVVIAARDLANYRIVSGDEAWIVSVSHQLATDGVLGTEITGGLFNIDRHYFVNPPGQNLLHLPAFWLFGSGLLQARWMSILSAVALIWIVATLSWRWYGRTVSVIAVGMLTLWRSSLISLDVGIPLLSVARSARHDISAVMWMWVAVLGVDAMLRRPTRWVGLGTGIACAAASLTQFYGPFVFPTILGILWWQSGGNVLRTRPVLWMLVGFLTPIIAYGGYVGAHWSDATLQFTYTFGDRMNYADPLFALKNLWREFDRFLPLTGVTGFGNWLLLVGVPVALLFLAHSAVQHRRGKPDGTLLLTIVVPGLLLGVIDTTKAPIYALALLPSLCLLMAVSMVRLFQWTGKSGRALWGKIAVSAIVVLASAEGAAAYWRDGQHAQAVSNYTEVSQRIAMNLPPGALTAGAERWWLGLRPRPYIALNSLFARWRFEDQDEDASPSLSDIVNRMNVQFILVNNNVMQDVIRYSNRLQQDFSTFLVECTNLESDWDDRTYGHIAVHSVNPTCSAQSEDNSGNG